MSRSRDNWWLRESFEFIISITRRFIILGLSQDGSKHWPITFWNPCASAAWRACWRKFCNNAGTYFHRLECSMLREMRLQIQSFFLVVMKKGVVSNDGMVAGKNKR